MGSIATRYFTLCQVLLNHLFFGIFAVYFPNYRVLLTRLVCGKATKYFTNNRALLSHLVCGRHSICFTYCLILLTHSVCEKRTEYFTFVWTCWDSLRETHWIFHLPSCAAESVCLRDIFCLRDTTYFIWCTILLRDLGCLYTEFFWPASFSTNLSFFLLFFWLRIWQCPLLGS